MPVVRLVTTQPGPPIPVELPGGGRLLVPRPQFRCLVLLPGFLTPRDAIVDTGSPLTWMPERIWSQFRLGVDYEWLPYPPGYAPPTARTAGWAFQYRMARLLASVTLMDASTDLTRTGVTAQFADGDPPAPPGSKRPPHLVLGLWGGFLEGTRIAITPDPQTGGLAGAIEF